MTTQLLPTQLLPLLLFVPSVAGFHAPIPSVAGFHVPLARSRGPPRARRATAVSAIDRRAALAGALALVAPTASRLGANGQLSCGESISNATHLDTTGLYNVSESAENVPSALGELGLAELQAIVAPALAALDYAMLSATELALLDPVETKRAWAA